MVGSANGRLASGNKLYLAQSWDEIPNLVGIVGLAVIPTPHMQDSSDFLLHVMVVFVCVRPVMIDDTSLI